MTTKIQLSDWETLAAELEQFGATGHVTTDSNRIRVDSGSAYIEVTKAGTLSTGMPLHDLEHRGDVTVIIDHDNGSITVESESLTYTFRRP